MNKCIHIIYTNTNIYIYIYLYAHTYIYNGNKMHRSENLLNINSNKMLSLTTILQAPHSETSIVKFKFEWTENK